MSNKFFVTKIADGDPVYDNEDAAIEAAKALAQAEPGTMFYVADQDDTVIVPKPDPVVTKVE
jgi:hypothetical protein